MATLTTRCDNARCAWHGQELANVETTNGWHFCLACRRPLTVVSGDPFQERHSEVTLTIGSTTYYGQGETLLGALAAAVPVSSVTTAAAASEERA